MGLQRQYTKVTLSVSAYSWLPGTFKLCLSLRYNSITQIMTLSRFNLGIVISLEFQVVFTVSSFVGSPVYARRGGRGGVSLVPSSPILFFLIFLPFLGSGCTCFWEWKIPSRWSARNEAFFLFHSCIKNGLLASFVEIWRYLKCPFIFVWVIMEPNF